MDQHILEVVQRAAAELDCAHSLSLDILMRHNEWDQIATRSLDPVSFLNHESYYRAIRAVDLIRKCGSLPTTFDKKKQAVDSWYSSERQCFCTNRFLSRLSSNKHGGPLEDFLDRVKKRITEVLGPVPGAISLRFGPGATYNLPGRIAAIPNKISHVPEMTGGCWLFARDFLDSAWRRSLGDALFGEPLPLPSVPSVPGNRFTTVPKDGRTDRGIAIEPALNISVQLGIGNVIRSRLNRYGLLRSNSQEVHRNAARLGSITNDVSTLDLSSASDTVAYELVRRLLPHEWFQLLDACRSPKTFIDGRWIFLEKFSSMGNGYTFELETLIFWAIADAFKPRYLTVFGDDIIVDADKAPALVQMLGILGFSLNPRKSFLEGSFRESCGGDYFDGFPVRSPQIKDLSMLTVASFFSLHNQLVRGDLVEAAAALRRLIPKRFRHLGGPTILGDIVLHGVDPIYKIENSIRYIRCLKATQKKIPLSRWDDHTAVASLLYGVDSEGISFRGAPVSYSVGWVPYS